MQHRQCSTTFQAHNICAGTHPLQHRQCSTTFQAHNICAPARTRYPCSTDNVQRHSRPTISMCRVARTRYPCNTDNVQRHSRPTISVCRVARTRYPCSTNHVPAHNLCAMLRCTHAPAIAQHPTTYFNPTTSMRHCRAVSIISVRRVPASIISVRQVARTRYPCSIIPALQLMWYVNFTFLSFSLRG
jgi:hypothetical protein